MSNTDATSHEAPTPIPVPPNFPVTWDHADDEGLFWHTDVMHFPEPITPMMVGFNQSFNEGIKRAAQACEVPIQLIYRRINTYNYGTTVPRVPPEEMEAQGKKAQEKLGAMMGQLWELWETEWLPEIHEHLAFWEAFDLRGASMSALLAHLEETWSRHTRLWDIHFLAAFPFLLAPSLFEELYQDLFGKERALDAYRLSQGLGNKTVEGGHALWELSRKAMASPQVRSVLEENDAADVSAALEGFAEGQAFLAEFGAYLEEYGQRSDIFVEVGDPHWIENPVTPIKNLQDYLSQPSRNLKAELDALATERKRLIAEARERLKGYPLPVVEQFEFLLKAAQAGIILQEDHNHWIDQRGTYKVRRVLLEFGRRLADAGVIESPDDVFYLTPGELQETASALPKGDRHQTVAARKAETDRFRAVQPPPALGTPHPGPPPDSPLGRAIGKLRPGDIMVAPATMLAWTPLFASIAAVVTDAGGVLSHAAIVAREYNIPAVLGTGKATSLIRDGQTLEVDGDAGSVRIVESS